MAPKEVEQFRQSLLGAEGGEVVPVNAAEEAILPQSLLQPVDVGGHDLVPCLPAYLTVDQREMLQVYPQGGRPGYPALPDAPSGL